MHGPSAAVSMLNPDFRDILSALNTEHAEYLLVGAYAVAAHGIPRATGDIDLWIRPTPQNADAVWNALEKFGAALDHFSRGDLEKPDLVFQFGVAPQRIDLMTSIEGVDFDAAWTERVSFRIDGLEVPTIGLRHLIINKKATGRPQDIADASRLSKESEE
jgi:nucleotidyltransferase DUF2204